MMIWIERLVIYTAKEADVDKRLIKMMNWSTLKSRAIHIIVSLSILPFLFFLSASETRAGTATQFSWYSEVGGYWQANGSEYDASSSTGNITTSGSTATLDGAGSLIYNFSPSDIAVGWGNYSEDFDGRNISNIKIYVEAEDDAFFGDGADIFISLYSDYLGSWGQYEIGNLDGSKQDYGTTITVINSSGAPRVEGMYDTFAQPLYIVSPTSSAGAGRIILKGDSNDKTIVYAVRFSHGVSDTGHTVNLSTQGSGSTNKSPNYSSYSYSSPGTNNVTISAHPSAGWQFKEWTGEITGNLSSQDIATNQHIYATAVFEEEPDTTDPNTNLTGGPSGTITYDDVTFTYSGSDNKTLTSNLIYSYKLEGYDSNWSGYTASTAKNYYNLSNGDYIFKVRAKDEAGNVDLTYASMSFTVNYVVTSITVTSPNGGEQLEQNSSQTITWDSYGVGSNVKIELYTVSGGFYRTISSSTPNDSTFSWDITTSYRTATDYKILITSTTSSSYSDFSDSTFSIVPDSSNNEPVISGYVEPSSGDTNTYFYWYVNYQDADGDPASTKLVSISTDGSAHGMSLDSGSASNGIYKYGPRTLPEGTHSYTFTFSDGKGGTINKTYSGPSVSAVGSDTTPPAVTIDSPTTGSTLVASGSTLNIGGTASDNIGVTSVTWSNDRGGSGTATGTTSWSVIGITLQRGTNVITVTAKDAANNLATDTLTVTYNPFTDTTHNSTDVPKSIFDKTTITSTLNIADTNIISDVNVGITLTHTYDADLDIFLIGPDGTRVELSTDNGGADNNYTDTIFDDEASSSITSGTAPFSATFKPEGLLSALDGIPANGSWTLEIYDDATQDTGTLTGWYLNITPVPDGLSKSFDDTGIEGIERTDGGDDSNNLDTSTGNPKVDVEYKFIIVLKDSTGNPPQSVKLYLTSNPVAGDFHAYDLTCSNGASELTCNGDVASGATYEYTTLLGPAASYEYYFEAVLADGSTKRYPALTDVPSEITGPSVKLLNGYGMAGIPRDITSVSLDGPAGMDCTTVYRWVSYGLSMTLSGNNGEYELVTTENPLKPGEGYFVNRATCTNDTLPELNYPDISKSCNYSVMGADSCYEVPLDIDGGWNMVSNPYDGNVKLSDIWVQKGTDTPVTWTEATANGWIEAGLYYYDGSDWDKTYSTSFAPDGKFVPWLGYWVYLYKTDDTYYLVIPRP